MLDLSIIIVNYNTKKYLLDCLDSIYKTTSKKVSFEIIVVDNGSTDNSVDALKKNFPQITVLENTNEGFAKANNKGVKVARGRYLLFLNPDTVVYDQVLEGMLEFMNEHQDAGAATCKLVMANGKLDYACHRGFPTPWNSFCYFSGLNKLFPKSKLLSGYKLGWLDQKRVHEIDALAGAFMLVRREAGEEVGWWDEDYFFNGEDLDFCYVLKEKDWKIYFVPQYVVLHYSGVAGGTKKHSQEITVASKEAKKFITYHRFEAMRIFYRKHYLDKYPKFITWLVLQAIKAKEKIVLGKIR